MGAERTLTGTVPNVLSPPILFKKVPSAAVISYIRIAVAFSWVVRCGPARHHELIFCPTRVARLFQRYQPIGVIR